MTKLNEITVLVVVPFTCTPSAGVDNLLYIVKYLRGISINAYAVNLPFRTTISRYKAMKRSSDLWLRDKDSKQLGKVIVIYPEIVKYNFLGVKNYIVYVLNHCANSEFIASAAGLWVHGNLEDHGFINASKISLEQLNVPQFFIEQNKKTKNTIAIYARKCSLLENFKLRGYMVTNVTDFHNSHDEYSKFFKALNDTEWLIVAEPTRVALEGALLGAKVVFVANDKYPSHLGDKNIPNVFSVSSIDEAARVISTDSFKLKSNFDFEDWRVKKTKKFEDKFFNDLNNLLDIHAQFRGYYYFSPGLIGGAIRTFNTIIVKSYQVFRKII